MTLWAALRRDPATIAGEAVERRIGRMPVATQWLAGLGTLCGLTLVVGAVGAKAEPAAEPKGKVVELRDGEAKDKAAAEPVPMETVTITGDSGEAVTVRMKQGGFAGWIERNKPYRKRKLGDLEPSEIVAKAADSADADGKLEASRPAGGLAAITAIRGGSAGEPAGLPTPGKQDGGPGISAFGGLEVELLGLAAAVAITSAPDVVERPAPPVAAPAHTAVDDLAKRLVAVTQKYRGESNAQTDHVALCFLLPAAAQTGKSAPEVALLTDIAQAAKQVPGSSIEVRVSTGAGGKGGPEARRAVEKRLAALTGLLRARGFDAERVSGSVVPMAQGVDQSGQTGDSLIVFRVRPPRSAN